MSTSLGLTIPNANYAFTCAKAKMSNDHLFIFTTEHEVIVYAKQEDKINNISDLKRRYVILTQAQSREDIEDAFIMNSSHSIVSFDTKLVLIISKQCIIHYFNLLDGLCVNKINLSSFKSSNESIVHISEIGRRFLIIIFKAKIILFDSFAKVIFKEEPIRVLLKQKVCDDLLKDSKAAKEEYELIEVEKLFQIKDNSFFVQSQKDETVFLQVVNIKAIESDAANYEEVSIKIIKQSFNLRKFFNKDSIHCTFAGQEFLFHNINQVIYVSFLDSVEELTALTSHNTKSRYPIKYLSKIFMSEVEYLLVLFTDLRCELYTYDKKFRELKLHKEFALLVEDELMKMSFIADNNVLIGYTDQFINLFDFRRFTKKNEKFADRAINLKDLFNKQSKPLFFTNYFKDNFHRYIEDIEAQFLQRGGSYKVTTSLFYAFAENRSIYYIFGTNTGKVGIIDVFFTENLGLNPVLIIDYHQSPIEMLLVYDNRTLIVSSSDGMISFTDISLQKLEAAINKTAIEKQELDEEIRRSSITQRTQLRRKSSVDEITPQLNYSYVSKKAQESAQKKLPGASYQKLTNILLIPSFNLKNFDRLRRILRVVPLDPVSYCKTGEERKKISSLLAFDMENNDMIILRMDTIVTLYRFNQGTPRIFAKAVYHIIEQKSFIFYLSDNTVKVCSYATRSCDRHITALDQIYTVLRVEEKLGLFFLKQGKLSEYVSNVSMTALRFDDPIQDKKNRRSSTAKRQEVFSELTIQKIKELIKDPQEKQLFCLKLFENANVNRQRINMTQSKYEAMWMKRIEHSVIDEMISIINQEDCEEYLKKIQIMNLMYNPLDFSKLQEQSDSHTHGISGSYLRIGQQYNEYLMLNYDDYFTFLEQKAHEQAEQAVVFRTNYHSFLSLFHIWNFVLDYDIFLYRQFKISQPIFDVFPLLVGYDSACSLLLAEEKEIDPMLNNNHFNQHFHYFMQELRKAPNANASANAQESKSNPKNVTFRNKSFLLESYQGYLVNMKNYKESSNLSHLFHLALFGSLIAMLGFNDNAKLCEFIENEKNILKILSKKKLIEYSNYEMFISFLGESNDNLLLTNKDLLLLDYLEIQYTILTNSKLNLGRKAETELIRSNIIFYLSKVYKYLFNINGLDNAEGVFKEFPKLTAAGFTKECIAFKKISFLSEFELSLITIVICYNHIAHYNNQSDKLEQTVMIKVTEMLILFIFKLTKEGTVDKSANTKNVVELLGKSTEVLDVLYKDNMSNYARLLVDFYTNSRNAINMESKFKTYEIGNYAIMKSEENPNFFKIILAKLIKNYSKTRLEILLELIDDDFKKKSAEPVYFSYLIEILWILFRERSARLIQHLPSVISLLMTAMALTNKELKSACLDSSKKLLLSLLFNYPMIAFHQPTQKLAVGGVDGKVIIYDMGTGNVWKNLAAHNSELSAITFDLTGNILITYSSPEYSVKCWKISLTNFFSNFFTSKDGYYKQHKFSPIKEKVTGDEMLRLVKFQQVSNKEHEILLIRENKSVEMLNI